MPLIMNSRDEDVQVRAFGNTFTFKGRQIKDIYREDIARFIVQDRRDQGFVELPQELEDLELRQSPEGKALVEEKRKEGINNYCAHLRTIVYNLEVSMRQDLERANIKADPRVFASSGEINAMEQLVKYQARKEDEDEKRIARVKDLEKQLKGKTA